MTHDTPHAALRTGHSVTTHRADPRPVWGQGADGPQPQGRAAAEDRLTREKWGVKLKSAYVRMLAIPDVIAAGDLATARGVLGRIDQALSITGDGQWTAGERKRLREMRRAWHRRAQGRDLRFQVTGWTREPLRTGRRFEDSAEVRRVGNALREMDEWLDREVKAECKR